MNRSAARCGGKAAISSRRPERLCPAFFACAVLLLAGCARTARGPAPGAAEFGGAPKTITTASGASYRIRPATDAASLCHDAGDTEPFGAPAADPDSFAGKARGAVKTSIANAPVQQFESLCDLLQAKGFDWHSAEVPKTKRSPEEQANVAVDAYLFASKKELPSNGGDNDYHLILGCTAQAGTAFLNVEVSGLPKSSATDFATLENARNDYKALFGSNIPGGSYQTYDPPIPVRVTGSLFFDSEHTLKAHGLSPVGPGACKPATAWEIHPVTAIEFEPGE